MQKNRPCADCGAKCAGDRCRPCRLKYLSPLAYCSCKQRRPIYKRGRDKCAICTCIEKQRQKREAHKLAAEQRQAAGRCITAAWPGLRGRGGEWEHGPTDVQGWATLDWRRI